MSSPTALFDRVRRQLLASDRFVRVESVQGTLRAFARDVEAEAWYQLSADPGGSAVWVGLYTPDRWLSESIEADLMHQGDKIEDLLEEELIDQGVDSGTGPGANPGADQGLAIEHFRDDDKCYVFRSRVNTDQDDPAGYLTRVILAYEACFGQLGDMSAQDEVV